MSARIGLSRGVAGFESAQLVVPMTLGFLRPTVLVPASWRDWTDRRRRYVLLHELAHVKRLDVAHQIIGRLAVGVAMAASARLDQRVFGILDQARSRFPVSRRLAGCLLAVTAILVVAVAATRLVERSASAVADANDAIQNQHAAASDAENQNTASDTSGQVTVTGVVLTPHGQPAPGARVFAQEVKLSSYLGNEQVRLLAKTTTGDDGSFTLTYQEPDRPELRGVNQNARTHQSTQFVATADRHSVGFSSDGLVHVSSNGQRRSHDAVRIELARPDPLRGRLIDLEGRPVEGAKILVKAVAPASEPLDAWFQQAVDNPRPGEQVITTIEALNSRAQPIRFPYTSQLAAAETFPTVETDREGRFTVPNVGPDRLVVFEVTSPAVARTTVKMVTHRGPDVFDAWPDPRVRDRMIHGENATIAVEPAVTVKGLVADADTGEPIAGCKVEVAQVAGSLMRLKNFASTTADDSGRYVLERLPPEPPDAKGYRGYRIRFTPPLGAPYFSTDLPVRISSDKYEATFDARLPRARLISGRITNDNTGAPVRAIVGYLPMLDNKTASGYPNFRAGMRTVGLRDFRLNEAGGSFRVPAINGRGVLCVTAVQTAAYGVAGHADRIDGLQHGGDQFGVYHLFGAPMCNEFREVNLSDDDPDPTIDVALRALSRRTVRLVDAQGQPVDGCLAVGLMPDVPLAKRQPASVYPPLESAETQVIGLEVESPRAVALYHSAKNIGAVVVMREEDQATTPLTVTLEPCGRIRGRLLDASGKPAPGRKVYARGLPPVELPQTERQFGPPSFRVFTETVRTGADGRFETAGVIPGIRYQVMLADLPPKERPTSEPYAPDPPTRETPVVEPGQVIDIGEMTLQPISAATSQRGRRRSGAQATRPMDVEVIAAERQDVDSVNNADDKDDPQQQAADVESTRADAASHPGYADRVVIKEQEEPTEDGAGADTSISGIRLSGRVVDASGKGVANAVLYQPITAVENEVTPDDIHLVRRGVTDRDGRFSVEVTFRNDPAGATELPLIAHAPSFGIAWVPLQRVANQADITLTLASEKVIRGRIVTTEGQPVAEADVTVQGVLASSNGSLDAFLTAWKQETNLAGSKLDRQLYAILSPLLGTKSDTDGRFEIRGIGGEQIAIVGIAAPSIATTQLWVVNRDGFEPRPFHEAAVEQVTSRFRNIRRFPHLTGPAFNHVVEPGLIVDGTVFVGDDRKPVPGAFITAVETGAYTKADAKGRFALRGLPHGRYSGVRVRPPHPESDLMVRTVGVKGKAGELTTTVDIVLARGVVVTGRVTNGLTENGVAGSIRFVPLPGNPHFDMPGFRNTQGTVDSDGRFRFVSIPGPGVLMLQASGGERMGEHRVTPYRQAEFSNEDREHVTVTQNGADRYFTAFDNSIESLNILQAAKYVDLDPDGEPVTSDFNLDRGRTVEMEILDHQGEPLSGVYAAGVTDTWPVTFHLSQNRCTIYGLGTDRPRELLLLHAERGLAGSLQLNGSESSPVTAKLFAAGAIKGRAVHKDGAPLASAVVNVNFGDDTTSELYRSLRLDQQPITTDEQGGFQVNSLVPGQRFVLNFVDSKAKLRAQLPRDQRQAIAGQTRDYGDVTVKRLR